jgi:hypothetical protein
MLGQNRKGRRRSSGPVAGEEDSDRGACSRDESTEKYVTGRERCEILGRQGTGARVFSRPAWSTGDPGVP